ncbi:MAG: protein kinase [Planctomycetota bacterium]|nr:protein kinase [Planctomycetota bacterium]
MNNLPQVGQFIGPYQVVEKLGQGGMGAVYKAAKGSQFYAVKVLLHASEEDLLRFQREAQALAQVDRHPNIVRVHSYSDSPYPYIVQSFVEGQSLGALLKDRGSLTEHETLKLAVKVASALKHIHSFGLLHRDLKPENILVRASDSEYLVTDFGLVKSESAEALTKTGEFIGTPSYMAPEQWGGESENMGPWTDVWALGVMLYELCTGQRPFLSENLMALARQAMFIEVINPRDLNPNISESLQSILLKTLEKDPLDRYQSAGELLRDLERCKSGERFPSTRRGFVERSNKRVAHTIGVKLMLLLTFAFLGAGSFIAVQHVDFFLKPSSSDEKRTKKIGVERWSRELLSSSEFIRGELKLVPAGAELDHIHWREFKEACQFLKRGSFASAEARLKSLANGRGQRLKELEKLGVFVITVEKKDWQGSLFQLAKLSPGILTQRQRCFLERGLLRMRTMELLFHLSVSPELVVTSFNRLVQSVYETGESTQAFWDQWYRDIGQRLSTLDIKYRNVLGVVQRIEALRNRNHTGAEDLKLRLRLIEFLRAGNKSEAAKRYIDYLELTSKNGVRAYDWEFIRSLQSTLAFLNKNTPDSGLLKMYKAVLVLAKCGFCFEDLGRFLQLLEAYSLFERYEGNPYNSYFRSSLIVTDDLFPPGAKLSKDQEQDQQKMLERKFRELNKALANKELNKLFRALAYEERGHLIALHSQRLNIGKEAAKRRSRDDYRRALQASPPKPDQLQFNYARESKLELSFAERTQILEVALKSLEDRYRRSKAGSLAMSEPGLTYFHCSYREYLRRKSDIYRLLSELELRLGGNYKAALGYAKLALAATEGRWARFLVVRACKALKRTEDFERELRVFVERYPMVVAPLFKDDEKALKIVTACLIQKRRFVEARLALNALEKLDVGAAKVLEEVLRLALKK